MGKVIAAKEFSANGVYYIAGDEINNISFEQIAKLNELGYIEPLTQKELILIKRDLESNKKGKEEKL